MYYRINPNTANFRIRSSATKAVAACSQIFISQKDQASHLHLDRYCFEVKVMAKKRKAGGRPAGQNPANKQERTKFDIEERFDDSEDEFQAGRDQILLDEAPESKRRRRVAEEGSIHTHDCFDCGEMWLTSLTCRGISSIIR